MVTLKKTYVITENFKDMNLREPLSLCGLLSEMRGPLFDYNATSV